MQPTDPILDELQEIFDRIDENDDGSVSFEEFRSVMHETGALRDDCALRASFERIDTDGNGRIDIAEMRAWLCEGDRQAFRLRKIADGDRASPDGDAPTAA